ncbi:MAG: hypothetical protein UU22_C0016G0044 [Parcubacteria group bacterium GW2011_GWA2_40_8]|nr:MAG: hypothetical protein UU22_C0016G0044 [Parcubacteria group bacterium GW2011_GWA2_40_8]
MYKTATAVEAAMANATYALQSKTFGLFCGAPKRLRIKRIIYTKKPYFNTREAKPKTRLINKSSGFTIAPSQGTTTKTTQYYIAHVSVSNPVRDRKRLPKRFRKSCANLACYNLSFCFTVCK